MIDAEDPFRLAPGALRCPYPHYEALREQGATVWSEELAAFVISGHEHAAATLRQPDVASSRRPTGPGLAALTAAAIDRCRARGQLSELAEAHLRAPTPRTVFTIDPPEHSQMRKLISRILSPSKAREWEPLIRARGGPARERPRQRGLDGRHCNASRRGRFPSE